MVEGGAAVISSFLGSGVVDGLLITVAPTLVGDGGVSYDAGRVRLAHCARLRLLTRLQVPALSLSRSRLVGRDSVVVWTAARERSGGDAQSSSRV